MVRGVVVVGKSKPAKATQKVVKYTLPSQHELSITSNTTYLPPVVAGPSLLRTYNCDSINEILNRFPHYFTFFLTKMSSIDDHSTRYAKCKRFEPHIKPIVHFFYKNKLVINKPLREKVESVSNLTDEEKSFMRRTACVVYKQVFESLIYDYIDLHRIFIIIDSIDKNEDLLNHMMTDTDEHQITKNMNQLLFGIVCEGDPVTVFKTANMDATCSSIKSVSTLKIEVEKFDVFIQKITSVFKCLIKSADDNSTLKSIPVGFDIRYTIKDFFIKNFHNVISKCVVAHIRMHDS